MPDKFRDRLQGSPAAPQEQERRGNKSRKGAEKTCRVNKRRHQTLNQSSERRLRVKLSHSSFNLKRSCVESNSGIINDTVPSRGRFSGLFSRVPALSSQQTAGSVQILGVEAAPKVSVPVAWRDLVAGTGRNPSPSAGKQQTRAWPRQRLAVAGTCRAQSDHRCMRHTLFTTR